MQQKMRTVGLEPARYRYQRILNPPRLPFRHSGNIGQFITTVFIVQAIFLLLSPD